MVQITEPQRIYLLIPSPCIDANMILGGRDLGALAASAWSFYRALGQTIAGHGVIIPARLVGFVQENQMVTG